VHAVILTVACAYGALEATQILVVVCTYALIASVPAELMRRLRGVIREREKAIALAAERQEEKRRKEVGAQRRAMLASVGHLALSLAHEINNPLFALMGNLQYLRESREGDGRSSLEEPDPEVRAALQDSLEAADAIKRIIKETSAFAGAKAQEPARLTELDTVVAAVRKLVGPSKDESIQWTWEGRATPPITASESSVTQILLNLVLNAREAVQAAGRPGSVDVYVGTDVLGRAILRVRDTGVGIDPEVFDRIFLPFYTGRQGAGAGLGLALVHEAVEELGGRVDVESTPNTGSVFTVRIPPVHGGQVENAQAEPVPSQPIRESVRVLVVDDDERVARMLLRRLQGHDVRHVQDAESAISLLMDGSSFDLVLCDVVMPTCSGVELFQRVREDDPDRVTSWVFMTGGALSPADRAFLEAETIPCLLKPVSDEDLHGALSAIAQTNSPTSVDA
jgi:signal transduction histidine kinase/CheY-like chemotaxis protein